MQKTRPCDLWRFDILQCFFCRGMVERMSQASGSNVVNYTSTEKLKWYLTCIMYLPKIGSPFGMIEWSSFNSAFLMLKFGLGNHSLWCTHCPLRPAATWQTGQPSTCRDYHHYHYPNYCNLDQSRLGLRLKDPTGLQPEVSFFLEVNGSYTVIHWLMWHDSSHELTW